jgi:hypothetical protein
MANQHSYLDQLSPTEVFRLLAAAAEKHRGRYLDNVRIVFPETAPIKYVAIEIPDPYAEDKGSLDEAGQEVFKTLVEAFQQMTGRGERGSSPGGETRPLLESLAWLMLRSAEAADDPPAAENDEYLVTTAVITEKKAELLFKNISFHATATRVSSWENRPGATGGAGSRYLFHLKDDHRRKSSFDSLSASGAFEMCRLLRGFEMDGRVVFLPPDTLPGETKLKYFCRLLENAPLFFSDQEESSAETSPLLAALMEWPLGEDRPEPVLEFLYLVGMRFFKQEFFTRRKVGKAAFEFMDLKESRRALDGLGEAIKSAQPYIGYRLELRRTKHIDSTELRRLNEQKARIEYSLAYLQSISKPRPVLMRFTRNQLPALAAGIRGFPMQVIYDGSIKYGFQSTRSQPGGYHFILLNPAEATREKLDPLLLFQGLDVPHMRFHLDPFWARHYFEGLDLQDKTSQTAGALIFVPEGCALFPTIHSWERGNMDFFLRETMEHWFREQLDGRSIPQRPVYIFDGQPREKAPISVSILDRDRMESLHTRLGWINDNLAIDHALEHERLFKEMAENINWSELARDAAERTGETRERFKETALAAGREMAQTTSEMTRILTSEINRVAMETHRMTRKIRKIDERLRQWDEILDDMEGLLQQIRDKKQEASLKKAEAKNEFWRMEQEVDRELRHSEKRRQELQEKIEQEIKNMRTASARLKERLKTFKL